MSVVDGEGRTARAPGLARWLARVAPRDATGEIMIALVADARMRSLNRRYRRKDYATDVLSFAADASRPARGALPWPPAPGLRPLGDIVIARGVAARQAREEGHSVATELRLLALHGLLHLLGYDHETDRGRMTRLEHRLRRRGGLERRHIHRKRLRASVLRQAQHALSLSKGGGGAGPRLKAEGRRLKGVPGARCLESARRGFDFAQPRPERSRRVAGVGGGAPAQPKK